MNDKKIKIEKKVNYYLKDKLIKTHTAAIMWAASIEEAKEIIKNASLNYVKNIKDMSAFESINAFVAVSPHQFTNYYKYIDFNNLQEKGNF